MAEPMERLPVEAARSIKEYTARTSLKFGSQFGRAESLLLPKYFNPLLWRRAVIGHIFRHIFTLRPIVPWSSIVKDAPIGRADKTPSEAACHPRCKYPPRADASGNNP